MYQVIIVIHILLGLGIIGLVLMQQGKGADAGATFGGGASGSVFGAQGAASFLSRTTAILATLFFLTSLTLAWLNSHTKTANSDIMTSQDTDKSVEEVKLPEAATKTLENTPPVAPITEIKSPETQAPTAPATTPPPNDQPEVKPAEPQPPVEESKPTDEPKKDVVEEKKADTVEEKPKAEHHEKKSTKHKAHKKSK